MVLLEQIIVASIIWLNGTEILPFGVTKQGQKVPFEVC